MNKRASSAFLFAVLSFSSANAADPEPYSATVAIDLTRTRSIRVGSLEKSILDRHIYFRSYLPPGIYGDERSMELNEIGAIPGRGIVVFKQTGDLVNQGYALEEDHLSPGRPTANSVERMTGSYVSAFRKAEKFHPGVPFAMAFANYPDWMSIKDSGKPSQLIEDWEKHSFKHEPRPELYPVCAEVIAAWFDRLKREKVAIPNWYTIQNEPSSDWDAKQLAMLTRHVSIAMRKNHPEVKVSGPCSAWPYPGADWLTWEKHEKRFIEEAGDSVGAYDLHFYSKGNWSLPPDSQWQAKRVDTPRLYEAQKLGVATIWDYGRLDAYLDLFTAYHMQFWKTDQPKPMIISEFGHQTVHPQFGPWNNDFKPWLYMVVVVRQWMTYLERPEIELTVPFILGESSKGYAPSRGMAIYNRPGAPEDLTLKATRFREFYQFFRDLNGQRIVSQVSDGCHGQWLRARAFLDGNQVYLLMHNSKGAHPVTARLNTLLGKDTQGNPVRIERAEIRRLIYTGNVPDPALDETMQGDLRIDLQYQPLLNLNYLTLNGEETAIVRLTLSGVPQIGTNVTETSHYAKTTLREIIPRERLSIPLVLPKLGKVVRAQLHIGLARDGGFPTNAIIHWNGQDCGAADLGWTKQVAEFHGTMVLDLPVSQLQEGSNVLCVEFPDLPSGGNPKLVTAKVVVSEE